jgi:purine-nucleoside phosphorylase
MRPNIDSASLTSTAQFLQQTLGPPPPIGIVLGSGLGAFAEQLSGARALPYAEIPHAPSAAVLGHAGKLVHGKIDNTPVVALSGRVHCYEGYPLERVVFLVRALAKWGVPRVLLTNAAGGVNMSYAAGDLMLIVDHLNLSGMNPLTGTNEEAVGPRFIDMTRAYDQRLSDVIRQAALQNDVTLREGVYAALAGPNYETPAEIRMLRTLGADAVGMSTVVETIALRHMGVRVAAVSCITNMGAGITGETLSHQEVKEVADRVAGKLIKLFSLSLPRMAEC